MTTSSSFLFLFLNGITFPLVLFGSLEGIAPGNRGIACVEDMTGGNILLIVLGANTALFSASVYV